MAILLSTPLAAIVRLSRAVGRVRRNLFISDCFDKCCITILLIKTVLETVSRRIRLSELRLEITVLTVLILPAVFFFGKLDYSVYVEGEIWTLTLERSSFKMLGWIPAIL